MDIGAILLCLVVFVSLVIGLGLPLVANLPLRADEKICTGTAAALIVIYLVAFGIYLLALPLLVFTVLPLAALGLFLARRHACLEILRDPSVHRMLAAWLIVAGWTLGFLALVKNYSGLGNGVVGDWVEHYQRAQFFLLHQPLNTKFIWIYTLTARPPLANLVTGAFLSLTRLDYAHYQVFSALESSLVFLPALLFVRWLERSIRAERLFLVLFLLNPLVLHNSTYPWTKLITAFFVLAGLYFFVRAREGNHAWIGVGAFVCLAAGFLAHYSAGPYFVALVVAWFWWRRREWNTARFWAETIWCALTGGLLLATWFAWAIHTYGVGGGLLSNTSVTLEHALSWSGLLAEKGRNIAATLVPHPFRHVWDYFYYPKHSPMVMVRDYAFVIYQLNLFFAIGSAGSVLLGWLLWKQWRKPPHTKMALPRNFWLFFGVFSAVIGIAVNGGGDVWGLANICLQPLIVLGLAFLAARAGELNRWGVGMLFAGLIVDFSLGSILHFYVEHLNFHLSHWRFVPGLSVPLGNDPGIGTNVLLKYLMHYAFLGDGPIPAVLLVALLIGLAALALVRWRQES